MVVFSGGTLVTSILAEMCLLFQSVRHRIGPRIDGDAPVSSSVIDDRPGGRWVRCVASPTGTTTVERIRQIENTIFVVRLSQP